jgi:DNA-binding NtrC family response regulator
MPHRSNESSVHATRILVVGRTAHIMVRVRALLESQGFVHLGATTDADAYKHMQNSSPDLLLLGGGVEASSRTALTTEFRNRRPGLPVVEHFGGPSGLVAHVRQALHANAPGPEKS